MDNILNYFDTLNSFDKFLWVVVTLAICSVLEGLFPLRNMRYDRLKHLKVNLVLLGTTMVISSLFGAATVGIFKFNATSGFGLLNILNLPVIVELILAVMLLDAIAQYMVHYLLHKISFMWRFHMVHHSDTHVDASTGTRHHPGDYFMRECFALIAIIVGAIPLSYYMIYRILTVIFTYLTHANLRIPVGLDKMLSWIFISPNMHKFHHHYERPWTDSNFGNIFSIWDRIFGTFVYGDTSKIRYGLDVLKDDTSENLGYQFKIPFNKEIKTDY
ncbi:MAG TPA: sterol desaturase family protein [Saprospiraceae bacterium]|nr:sterol desaturase family protein [Saprospiraceae bacterium]MCB9328784.1 sterol desaturase family protein [Lewinellaceae bacterium]HPK09615.1 sterol desaturase family protein [Saprospiraceae bacterium]HPQ21839.1 sterol desaturase family protein [Saprospiraceae bacterium]HRX29708.1 sterol desaturase family protein [Saprospiraceae bacterium]